ncbi:type VI secretion system contractile sheath large subunit, partial [Pseudoalteromonas ruthenica]|uniref:type VI secretion system contractile sheath domain-containing protein n=1 Tax=Pseudoalteromonas ruthenica TaxID=151081 RepID=UPI0011094AFF
SAIIHNEEFQQKEGSWRGLHHLVRNSETNAPLKNRGNTLKNKEQHKDLSKALQFDHSKKLKKINDSEFRTQGGQPNGAFIGDYQIKNQP